MQLCLALLPPHPTPPNLTHPHPPWGASRRLQFGTPEEDAHRRDFTINAMFYNINTGLIEDLTNQ